MDARSWTRRLLPLRAPRAQPLLGAVAAVAAMLVAGPADARLPRGADDPDRPRAARTESRARVDTTEPHAHAATTAKPRSERHHYRKQVGIASFYAKRFGGRKMADGTRLDLNDHVAASRTLPLGTEAKVTNLETGLSTRVTIQDRGPYAKGRILDLTPAAAESIGLTRKEGVAKVEVQPLRVPPPKDDDRKD